MFKRNHILLAVVNLKLISVAEAARKLGVTRGRVNQLIAKNRLPAQKIGRAYAIRENDLKLVENRKWGRPAKVKGVDKDDFEE